MSPTPSPTVANTVTQIQAVVQAVMDAEDAKKNLKPKKTDIGVSLVAGSIIGVPKELGIPKTISHLTAYQVSLEAIVAISHVFPGVTPYEGALATSQAMAEIYGFTTGVVTQTWFGDIPPAMLGVRTGPGPEDVIQVPWGKLTTPGLDPKSWFNLGANVDRTGRTPISFVISGEVRKKDEDEVLRLVKKVREILTTSSLYRTRALRVNFSYIWDSDNVDYNMDTHSPDFIDTRGLDKDDLVFNTATAAEVQRSIFSLIEHTAVCRQSRIPLKRGVLLGGGYGCGKTLTARVLASMCVSHGWTFLLCNDVRDLPHALRMATKYEPCVVFAEDIDRLMGGGGSDKDRSFDTDAVLNVIDGVELKNREVLTVLTTNDPENIHPAFLRPGRIDAIIPILKPDSIAAARLVRIYGRDLLSPTIDMDAVGRELALDGGQTPSDIRECIERSKLACIGRLGGGPITGHVTADDIVSSSRGMKLHRSMCTPKPADTRSDMEKAAGVIAQALQETPSRPSRGDLATSDDLLSTSL